MSRLVLLLSITLTAAGCALGPRYQRPDVAVPDAFRGATGDRRAAPTRSPTSSGPRCSTIPR